MGDNPHTPGRGGPLHSLGMATGRGSLGEGGGSDPPRRAFNELGFDAACLSYSNLKAALRLAHQGPFDDGSAEKYKPARVQIYFHGLYGLSLIFTGFHRLS